MILTMNKENVTISFGKNLSNSLSRDNSWILGMSQDRFMIQSIHST